MAAASQESTSRSRRVARSALPPRHTACGARSPRPSHAFRPRRNYGARCRHVRNLELLDPIFFDRGSDGGATLIGILDQTATGMGGRCYASACCGPRSIATKSNRVSMRYGPGARNDSPRGLRKQLVPVLDVERLLAKVMIGSAGPRDLLALGKSLDQTPRLAESVRLTSRPLSARMADTFGTAGSRSGGLEAPSLPRCPIRRR